MTPEEKLAKLRVGLATAQKHLDDERVIQEALDLTDFARPQLNHRIDGLTLHVAHLTEAIAALEHHVPKPEPYRPWVMNVNPAGQRYGRIGYVTNAGNGKADVAYDDGVGMNVDIKRHLILVADFGFTDKDRLRCACGSGFPSLWCCWDREPRPRDASQWRPRVSHPDHGAGVLEGFAPPIDDPSLTVRFDDGNIGAIGRNGLAYLGSPELTDEANSQLVCACGSKKSPLDCHPMSRPALPPLDHA